MQFTLISSAGFVTSFYLKSTALCYQRAYGGTIIDNSILKDETMEFAEYKETRVLIKEMLLEDRTPRAVARMLQVPLSLVYEVVELECRDGELLVG